MSDEFAVEMFHDGACRACAQEVKLLQRLDAGKGRVRFIDIAAPDFDASEHGKTHDELMAEMHGRLPNGEWVRGVEAFRHFYKAVGMSAPVALSRLPGVSGMLDLGYEVFAKHRVKLFRKCEPGDACEIPAATT